MYWDVILLFLFIYEIKEVTGSQYNRHLIPDDEPEHLHITKHDPIKSLVVYVNYKNGDQFEDKDMDDLFFSSDDGVTDDENEDYYKEEAKEQAKYLLYNYLLQASSSRGPDPKPALLKILRMRCKGRAQCEDKCNTNRKKKRNNKCVPNCKEVFDNLDLCKPPKPKRDPCRPSSDCGNQKWGKTMPPPPRKSRIYSNDKDDCKEDSCDVSSSSCEVDDSC